HSVQGSGGARQRGGRREQRGHAGRSGLRRRRYGELALACGDRGRAQAKGGRNVRQHCRCLQAAAPPAGPRYPEQVAQRFALTRAGAALQEAQGRDHQRGEVAAAQSSAHRSAGRAALRHQQAPRRLRGPSDAARREPRGGARGFSQELPGLRTRSALAQPRIETECEGMEESRCQRQGQGQAAPPRDPDARGRNRARGRRVPRDRAHGAEGNALVKQYQRLFEMESIDLKLAEEALSAIARKAMDRKTGARGLRSIMEGILLDTMFDLPSLEGVEEVVVSKEVVEGTARPLYIY